MTFRLAVFDGELMEVGAVSLILYRMFFLVFSMREIQGKDGGSKEAWSQECNYALQ